MKFFKFIILFLLFFFSNYPKLFSQNFDELIVKLKQDQNINALVARFNFKNNINLNYQRFLNLNEKINYNSLLSTNQNQLLNELSKYYIIKINPELKDSLIIFFSNLPEIENITENYEYKIESDQTFVNDPLYKDQWYLKTINADKAWNLASGKDVLIGVVDTGIDFYHPDLKNRLWINNKEDLNRNGKFEPWSDTLLIDGVFGDLNGIDDDGNGYIDDIIGFDFVNQYNNNLGDWSEFDPVPFDEHGHGTLVSGLIVAEQNNNFGITGLAYNSRLVTLRAFDFSGNGQSDNIASAIVYAALNKIKIINLSFGENFYSPILHDAIIFAKTMGCVVVASSGNNGWDRPHFPSDYEEVISVGSSNANNRRDQLSNYGNRLDLLAPGTNIITTSINADFRQVSGTSMAAPLVSASAALLIELNPDLNPDEIKGILKSTATDIYTIGWDRESGSGILNVSNALHFAHPSELFVSHPENNSYFSKSNIQSLSIIGTITNPLFDYYQVFINDESKAEVWDTLTTKIYHQIFKDTICIIDLNNKKNTNYVVRIVNALKNNRFLEKRFSFSIFDSDSFKISLLKASPVYFNDKRAILISAETDKVSELTLEITDLSTNKLITIHNQLKKDKYHQILLNNFLEVGKDYHCRAIFNFGNKIKKERSIIFNKSSDDFSIGNFRKKYNTLPLSYSFNGVIDIYGNQKKNIVVNDISGGIWQSTKIFQFDKGRFIQTDTMSSVWIPVGYGDSNGDGLNEIFTKAFGSTKLFQPIAKGSNPFNNIVFADTTNGDLWAAGMFDFDGDGKEELIAHTSSDIRIFKYSNGKYTLLDLIKPVEESFKIGTSPGIAFGNFDDDPNPELACALPDGRIFIYEFSKGKFQFEWADSYSNSGSPQFLEAADIDNDGINEIISANYGTTHFFGREVPEDPIWTLRILKNISKNNYSFVWNESFFGVKSGITQSGIAFRNGLFTGNIDKIDGDEIFLSVFPNLYIFKWDNNSRTMKPFGWFGSAFSNSGIVFDFDDNRINEFGFSSGRGFEFFELDTNFEILPPSGIKAWAINDSSAFIRWNEQNDADAFEIFEVLKINNEFFAKSISITYENSFVFSNMKRNQWNYFVIQALNTREETKSDFTQIIQIYASNPIYPTFAEQIDSNKFSVRFSGRLPDSPPNPGNFYFQNEYSDKFYSRSTNISGDNSVILVFSNPFKDTSLRLFCLSFYDYYNNPSLDSSINVIKNLKFSRPKELYLKNLNVISRAELIIQFSEPFKPEDAIKIENYSIKPFGEIQKLEIIEEDKVKIALGDTPLLGSIGYYYTITVNNVSAKSGNLMTKGSGNTLGFVFETENPQNAFVYPNPINLNIGDKVTFANIPRNSKIIITTINGEIIRELEEINNNGGVEWDLRTSKGQTIEPGTYIFTIESKNQGSIMKKFSVVR